MKNVFVILLILGNAVKAEAQAPENEINQMLEGFVSHLNNLELESFMDNFTEGATVFYPRNSFPIGRVSGKDALTTEFRKFFDGVRASREGPPYLSIVPMDREVELFGNMAIVTLHFQLGEEFHRRTLLLKKFKKKWLIDHIHASYLIPHNN